MRRTAAVLASLLIAAPLAAVAGEARTVFACSCAELTLDEALQGSDVAFVGSLVEINRPEVMLSSTDESRFIFEVDGVYKGEVHERQSIVTVSSGASCGLELRSGRALVFATREGWDVTPDEGEYAANLCNGTRALATDGDIPTSFGMPSAPLAGSSPVGADDGLASEFARNWPWVALGIGVVAAGVTMLVMRLRRRRLSPAH